MQRLSLLAAGNNKNRQNSVKKVEPKQKGDTDDDGLKEEEQVEGKELREEAADSGETKDGPVPENGPLPEKVEEGLPPPPPRVLPVVTTNTWHPTAAPPAV